MNRQAVVPAGRAAPLAPYSPGIRFGNLLFTAGAVGMDAKGKVPTDFREQTRNTMENLRAVLEAAGSGFDRVLKVTVFLTDMKYFAAMNEVYRSYFTGELPARSTIGVAALARPELLVEIEMVAHIP